MECDLYARIDCGDNETCNFVLLMCGSGDPEDVPVFEDEVVSEHRKIFSALEFADTPNSLVRRVDTNIVEAHWFFGDTLKAKEHLETLAELHTRSCYAIIWYETHDVLLLCAEGDTNSYYSEQWEGDTWGRIQDSSLDLIDVLDDIAKLGGVTLNSSYKCN